MLTDKHVHMHAAHKLRKKLFPVVQGCQSTLLGQNNGYCLEKICIYQYV